MGDQNARCARDMCKERKIGPSLAGAFMCERPPCVPRWALKLTGLGVRLSSTTSKTHLGLLVMGLVVFQGPARSKDGCSSWAGETKSHGQGWITRRTTLPTPSQACPKPTLTNRQLLPENFLHGDMGIELATAKTASAKHVDSLNWKATQRTYTVSVRNALAEGATHMSAHRAPSNRHASLFSHD